MRVSMKDLLEVVVPCALVLWILLEAFSAMFGPSSYRTLSSKRLEIAALQAETSALDDKIHAMTKRADMLHPSHLDAELLDERVRAVLGYADPDEIVIPMDQFDLALRKADRWEAIRAGQSRVD